MNGWEAAVDLTNPYVQTVASSKKQMTIKEILTFNL